MILLRWQNEFKTNARRWCVASFPQDFFCNRSVYTQALRWDHLQETHGPPPSSHYIRVAN
ncbi:hypothetical protein J3R75_001401 [Oligosphaera ethanolica]|uniref:Uncharacterized protein n=1 Tax=Oligosphaera ethanolica TaxID=760260 RepID=A0AAE3VFM7_9BACT|nr:hypothetical protein [Oligosphaera ethanolica]